MIPVITNTDDITKIWKRTIQSQCEMNNTQVRSLVSSRGQNLDKKVDDYIYETLSRTDLCALFEIDINPSEPVVTMEYSEDEVLSYVYAKLKVIIYGKESSLIAVKFKSRLESSEIRDSLWQQGIKFDEVTSIESVHEFINEVIYFRTDININFSFRLNVEKINIDNYFDDEPTPETISGGLQIIKSNH